MEGYGIVTDSLKWANNAYETLFSWALKDKDLKEEIEAYYQENRDDYSSAEACFYDFVEDWYENETFLWGGIEGLVTDMINTFEYDGDTVFYYEDCCIYVPAYIPLTKNSRVITQEDISRVLDKYLSPLVDGIISADWQNIRECG